LSQLVAPYVFLLGNPEDAVVHFSTRTAHAPPGRVRVASNKIEFSYLNGNLMVLNVHPLTLGLDRNSRNGGS
jgi:hypothetical protein